jgi:hypothetical protein
MKYIKLFEANKTPKAKSKELREKFLTLIDADIIDADKQEIEDALRSIFDIAGSPDEERVYIRYAYGEQSVKPDGVKGGHIFKENWIDNAATYKQLKNAYENLIHGNLELSTVFSYTIKRVNEERMRLAEEEIAYAKETLESMGYSLEFQKSNWEFIHGTRNPPDMLRLNVVKIGLDGSSIIEDKEYYSSLPKSIIKGFDMFMLQYKVPEEKAAEFANMLGSADWTKED